VFIFYEKLCSVPPLLYNDSLVSTRHLSSCNVAHSLSGHGGEVVITMDSWRGSWFRSSRCHFKDVY